MTQPAASPPPLITDAQLRPLTFEQLVHIICAGSPEALYDAADRFDQAAEEFQRISDGLRAELPVVAEALQSRVGQSVQETGQEVLTHIDAVLEPMLNPGYGVALRRAGDALTSGQQRVRDLIGQQVERDLSLPVEELTPEQLDQLNLVHNERKAEVARQIVMDLSVAYRDAGLMMHQLPNLLDGTPMPSTAHGPYPSLLSPANVEVAVNGGGGGGQPGGAPGLLSAPFVAGEPLTPAGSNPRHSMDFLFEERTGYAVVGSGGHVGSHQPATEQRPVENGYGPAFRGPDGEELFVGPGPLISSWHAPNFRPNQRHDPASGPSYRGVPKNPDGTVNAYGVLGKPDVSEPAHGLPAEPADTGAPFGVRSDEPPVPLDGVPEWDLDSETLPDGVLGKDVTVNGGSDPVSGHEHRIGERVPSGSEELQFKGGDGPGADEHAVNTYFPDPDPSPGGFDRPVTVSSEFEHGGTGEQTEQEEPVERLDQRLVATSDGSISVVEPESHSQLDEVSPEDRGMSEPGQGDPAQGGGSPMGNSIGLQQAAGGGAAAGALGAMSGGGLTPVASSVGGGAGGGGAPMGMMPMGMGMMGGMGGAGGAGGGNGNSDRYAEIPVAAERNVWDQPQPNEGVLGRRSPGDNGPDEPDSGPPGPNGERTRDIEALKQKALDEILGKFGGRKDGR